MNRCTTYIFFFLTKLHQTTAQGSRDPFSEYLKDQELGKKKKNSGTQDTKG